MMTVATHVSDRVRAALEQTVRALQWAESQWERKSRVPVCDRDPQITVDCEWAEEEARRACNHLAIMVSEITGPGPWTVVFAGHLLDLNQSEELSVVPIEKIRYLDNLRRLS